MRFKKGDTIRLDEHFQYNPTREIFQVLRYDLRLSKSRGGLYYLKDSKGEEKWWYADHIDKYSVLISSRNNHPFTDIFK